MRLEGIALRLRAIMTIKARMRRERLAPTLPELVEEARMECMLAHRYFESVSDPELVDHATYLIQATEKRYRHLLSLQRQLSIKQPVSKG